MAVDRDLERDAYFEHPLATEGPKAIDEDRYRDAFNGVEVHGRPSWNRIVAWFQNNFAREVTNRRGARGNERPAETRDRDIA